MNLLEAMRYLAALDQHRHFGRAAQACHITQPALSNALRALEGELGAVLVKRGRQYEGLTAEGEVTLAHAHRLLQGTEVLRQEIACLAGAPRGVLRIGAIPTAVPIAARFAARLRGQHPGIRPVLTNLSSQAIESGLESLAIDLALGYVERGGAVAGRLDLLPQYSERYFLVRRAAAGEGGAALVFGAPLRWADAAAYPLALLTAEMHNRVIVDGAFVAAGAPSKLRGGLEDGVHAAADRYASLYASAAAARRTDLVVTIQGVSNVAQYAETSRYLESLSIVREVLLQEVLADAVVFRLSVRGDLQALQREVASGGRLARADGVAGTAVFAYRP